MLSNFQEAARRVLTLAKKEMHELNHPYVSSEHLLLALLKVDENIASRFKDYKVDYKVFKEEIIKTIGKGSKPSQWFLYTPLLKRIIENAILDSKENNSGIVTTNHLFSSLLEEGEGVAIRILIALDVDIDELYDEFAYKLVNKKSNKKLMVEEYGVDLTEKALNGEMDPVSGRNNEIKRVIEILSRKTKNNPLLIGKAGVGKTAIIEELSNMISKGDVPLSLKNKRIINIDMATMVAGTKYRGEFEERVHKILDEIENNSDIILFIDEIHTLVGAGGAEGAIDASNIFKPALARGKLRCIGATTIEEYKKFIEPDSALERRFQKVIIEEPSSEGVKEILMKLKGTYENYHSVTIDEDIIDLIIKLSKKYIYDRNEPDRSIDILDEVCARVSLKESKIAKRYKEYNEDLKKLIKDKKRAIIKNDFEMATDLKTKEFELMNKINKLELNLYKKTSKKVSKNDVAKVVNFKTGIPIYEILGEKKSMIKNMDRMFKNKIIGQDDQIKEIVNIGKKIKLGLNDGEYSMLFCGPSGVGKTEIAKEFGKYLVGEKNVIKIDMSEYKEAHSVSKIIGSPPGYVGYSDNKNILEEIKMKPYCVLILDEIEKAHGDVINLFLQVLDEGKLKDSKGTTVRFDNVVIIMTSNIGFHDNNVGFNKNQKLNNKLNNSFSIPFMNRVDSVIRFNNLTYKDIEIIVKNEISKLKEKYNTKMEIKISNSVIKEIISLSDFESYGARKVKRLIKDKIEYEIIEALLNDKKEVYIKEIEKVM